MEAEDGVSASPGSLDVMKLTHRQRSFPERRDLQPNAISMWRPPREDRSMKRHSVRKCRACAVLWPLHARILAHHQEGSDLQDRAVRYDSGQRDALSRSFVKVAEGLKCDRTHNIEQEQPTVHLTLQYRSEAMQVFHFFPIRN